MKPVPKSLHTVTVLVKLTRSEMEITSMSAEATVELVLCILGLDEAPDPHGLRAAAIKQLQTPEA